MQFHYIIFCVIFFFFYREPNSKNGSKPQGHSIRDEAEAKAENGDLRFPNQSQTAEPKLEMLLDSRGKNGISYTNK